MQNELKKEKKIGIDLLASISKLESEKQELEKKYEDVKEDVEKKIKKELGGLQSILEKCKRGFGDTIQKITSVSEVSNKIITFCSNTHYTFVRML